MSDCSELFHPFLVFMQILWTHRFIHVFYRLDKIWFTQRCIYFFLEFLHVHYVFVSSLIFEFSPHGKHSCLSTKVGYISSTIPFSFLDDLLNLNSFLNLEFLQIDFEKLSPSFFIGKRDIYSFFQPSPECLVQIPWSISSSQNNHELVLFVCAWCGSIHLNQ